MKLCLKIDSGTETKHTATASVPGICGNLDTSPWNMLQPVVKGTLALPGIFPRYQIHHVSNKTSVKKNKKNNNKSRRTRTTKRTRRSRRTKRTRIARTTIPRTATRTRRTATITITRTKNNNNKNNSNHDQEQTKTACTKYPVPCMNHKLEWRHQLAKGQTTQPASVVPTTRKTTVSAVSASFKVLLHGCPPFKLGVSWHTWWTLVMPGSRLPFQTLIPYRNKSYIQLPVLCSNSKRVSQKHAARVFHLIWSPPIYLSSTCYSNGHISTCQLRDWTFPFALPTILAHEIQLPYTYIYIYISYKQIQASFNLMWLWKDVERSHAQHQTEMLVAT